MAIFTSYRGQSLPLYEGATRLLNPLLDHNKADISDQENEVIGWYYLSSAGYSLTAIIGVKNLLQIYEYLPIDNYAFLLGIS